MWLAIWYALFRLIWLFHVALYPEHQLGEFWRSDISFRSFACSFLMIFSLMPGAIVVGFMLGNVVFWLIPPARRTFDMEARDYPGTSFRDSMRGLFTIGAFVLVPGMVLALIAACFLKSLR